MTEWLLVALGVVLTVGTALFVAAEFSLVALDRSSVQRAVEDGDGAARPVLTSLRRLSTQLSAAQVGITLTTLALGWLATPSVGALLADPLVRAGVPSAGVETLAATLALVLATLFSMVFGELVPQFLGISAPLSTAKVVARPVQLFGLLAAPLISALNGSANAILRSVGVTPTEELSAARTPAELASVVRRSALAGTLDAQVARRVARTLDFGDRTAADIMTPRVRGFALERTATAADVVARARATGHSRFPVLGDDWDDIDGLVHVKAAIAVPRLRRERVPVSALMTDVTLVPETIGLHPLLLLLRGKGHQMAVVVDEYGGTSGVVTLEDVVEELVGEVADEHDRAVVVGVPARDGSWLVPGMWRPDEVRDRLRAPVPDGVDYETTAGFVMALLGRVPVLGDRVEIEGWLLRVEAMEDRRVERLRFVPLAALPPDELPPVSERVTATGRAVPAGALVRAPRPRPSVAREPGPEEASR